VPLEVADSSVKRYDTQDFPVTIAAPASNVELAGRPSRWALAHMLVFCMIIIITRFLIN